MLRSVERLMIGGAIDLFSLAYAFLQDGHPLAVGALLTGCATIGLLLRVAHRRLDQSDLARRGRRALQARRRWHSRRG